MTFCTFDELTDVCFDWPEGGCGSAIPDFVMTDGDLQGGDNISSLIQIQLLTNKLSIGLDGGGWWGEYDIGFQIGSELWTISEMPNTDNMLIDAERFVTDAMQPLRNQEIFDDHDITARYENGKMICDIIITKDNNDIMRFAL